MSKPTSVIEINGNRYDATTGQLISAIESVNRVKNQVIDGLVKPARPIAARHKAAKSAATPSGSASRARKHGVKSSARSLHRQTDKAYTLMRGGLKKPAGHLSRLQRSHSAKPRPETELRSKQIQKNTKVHRFGTPIRHKMSARRVVSGEILSRNKSKGTHSNSGSRMASTPALPSMVVSASHQKLERLLDAALAQADAHKQDLRRQSARHFWQRSRFWGPKKWLAVGVVLLAVIVLAMFIAWQKIPQLSVKAASIKAHVSATVPAYKPVGYQLATPATASGDSVTMEYRSTIEQQNEFDLTQKQSNLDSSSLAQTVIPQGDQVQTSQVNGNTVYIYGPHNDAMWVNNGILYTITNHSNLSSDELLKIAQGL